MFSIEAAIIVIVVAAIGGALGALIFARAEPYTDEAGEHRYDPIMGFIYGMTVLGLFAAARYVKEYTPDGKHRVSIG